jgi:hypothetical protein
MHRTEAGGRNMTVRLATTVSNIQKAISNEENVQIITRFFKFMKKIGYFLRLRIELVIKINNKPNLIGSLTLMN